MSSLGTFSSSLYFSVSPVFFLNYLLVSDVISFQDSKTYKRRVKTDKVELKELEKANGSLMP